MILGCNENTSLTLLLWCNGHGINSTYHCHYTMSLADLNLDTFLNCIQFNTYIACELSGFTSLYSFTNSELNIFNKDLSKPHAVLKYLVQCW